jgi:hypothetical protein
MKLDDYAIRQYLAELNWKAATDVVAARFKLQMPAGYEVTLVHQIAAPSVVIFYKDTVYRWHRAAGFSQVGLRLPFGSDPDARIYCQQVRGAP